jgi:hypothetical protein
MRRYLPGVVSNNAWQLDSCFQKCAQALYVFPDLAWVLGNDQYEEEVLQTNELLRETWASADLTEA